MWRRRRTTGHTPAADARPRDTGETADALVKRLHWTVLRPLATHLGGDEYSLLRGPGMELAEVREYQPSDDVRHIDWNVTARADRPFVREARVERALDVWFVLDLSPSLNWGTAHCLKRDRAVEFAAVAGQLLNRRGHRLGALFFDECPLGLIPPAAGRVHLLRLLAGLRDQPRPAGRGRTDLAAAFAHAGRVIRRRSLVLVVSDFLVPDGWQAPLGRLAQRHEVVAAWLRDPRESALPDVGVITLEDPETGAQLTVDTGDQRLRARFQGAAQAQADGIRADLAACGVDHLVLGTDEDLLPALIRFLNARRRRRTLRAHRAPTGHAGQRMQRAR